MCARSSIALFIAIAAAFAVLAFVTTMLSGGDGSRLGIWALAALVSLASLSILASNKPGRDCERREG
ncbi:hypothetical protein [Hyphomonas sp.]|uniref:hypothetical protein n=1 Tax=Hyphomonas sp. TaxID=87 RepID=UPI00391CF994